MEKKRSVEIILIGIFAIILGGWNLFHMAGGILYMLLEFSQIRNAIELLWYSGFIFYFLVFICFLIGGISFILLKKWGKVLVHVCLVIDILFRSFGIIRYWYIWFTMEKPSAIPENAYVMIPTYVIVLIEVAALYLITRPKVKDQFKVAERLVIKVPRSLKIFAGIVMFFGLYTLAIAHILFLAYIRPPMGGSNFSAILAAFVIGCSAVIISAGILLSKKTAVYLAPIVSVIFIGLFMYCLIRPRDVYGNDIDFMALNIVLIAFFLVFTFLSVVCVIRNKKRRVD